MQRSFHLQCNEKGLQAFLGAVSLQLRGQRLSRVRRSTGSVLLIDFGKIKELQFGRKKRRFGEWHLLVQMASWRVIESGNVLLDSRDLPEKIDSKISRLLKGKEIKQVSIQKNGSMKFDFIGGIELTIRKKYDKDYNSNWSLFYRDDWFITNADERDLYEINLRPVTCTEAASTTALCGCFRSTHKT